MGMNRINSAQTPARALISENCGLMMCSIPANAAGKHGWQADTTTLNCAIGGARDEGQECYLCREADVYNVTVDEAHTFVANGGFITHNCDTLQYRCHYS